MVSVCVLPPPPLYLTALPVCSGASGQTAALPQLDSQMFNCTVTALLHSPSSPHPPATANSVITSSHPPGDESIVSPDQTSGFGILTQQWMAAVIRA